MNIFQILKKFLKLAKNVWIIRIYLGFFFVGAIIYLYRHKERFAALSEVSQFGTVFLILLLAFAIFVCYVYVHYSTYRALNTQITYWQTFQVAAFSRLGVYIPGKIFYATNYYVFSRFLNIGHDKIGKNFVINNSLLFFTGALCSLLAISQLPFVARYFLVVLPILMIVLIHPKVLNRIFAVLLNKLFQLSPGNETQDLPDNQEEMSWSYGLYLKFIGLYFVLWFILGVMQFFCVRVFEPVGIQHFPLITAAAAAGLIIGLLAVFAPGGMGVREGIGIVMLSQIVSVENAVFACVLLRLAHVIADFVVGGIAAVAFIRKKRTFKENEGGNGRS